MASSSRGLICGTVVPGYSRMGCAFMGDFSSHHECSTYKEITTHPLTCCSLGIHCQEAHAKFPVYLRGAFYEAQEIQYLGP